jgi:hypothetical protein
VKDVEGRDDYQIDLVEVRALSPMVTMTPMELPEGSARW